ncbi:transmembrane protein 179B-like [Anneissia japonica]|uniref:transmembrane protein 179B-like n=1 Tax=Anneissia japonica TaxID=1529436 RepID=UPI001425BAE4|nr:transmembrane protein 179B-like [Anneissia japonica]
MASCSSVESRYSIVEIILLFLACGANLATLAFISMSRHDNDGSCLLFAEIQVISRNAAAHHSSKCRFPISVHIASFLYAAFHVIYWLYKLIRGQEGSKFLQVVSIFAYGILSLLLFVVSILITMGLKSLCNEIYEKSPRKRDNCRDYQNKRLGDIFKNPGYAKFYDILHNAEIASWIAFSIWFIVAALTMSRCYSRKPGYIRTRLEPDKPEVI